jgi:nicotinate-nucleotide adenylyltransferase
MTELATAGNPSFQVDDTDLTRPGPHYTVDLLGLLQRGFKGARWWLLVGSDSLRDLATWRHPHRLIERCRLGVLPRPGAEADVRALDQQIPGLRAAVDMLSGPAFMLSSSLLRQWVGEGRSVRYLVPDSVADYIVQHRLYRSTTGGSSGTSLPMTR